MAPGTEIIPLLLCSDGLLVLRAGAALGRLVRRLSACACASASPPAPSRSRRPAYSPAERFLPCHRLSIGIPRA